MIDELIEKEENTNQELDDANTHADSNPIESIDKRNIAENSESHSKQEAPMPEREGEELENKDQINKE